MLNRTDKVTIIAGPCSVESEEQMEIVCAAIQKHKLRWVRGGAFKPRSNIHSFQGLGKQGIDILKNTAQKYGLKCISEVTSTANLDVVLDCDALQIGTRNMTNYQLLQDVAQATMLPAPDAVAAGGVIANDTTSTDTNTQLKNHQKPILFKRGMAATINEWLCASEYITKYNPNVILCERGLRTFEDATRFTLDISAVPVVQKQSNLPICVDVSHAAGRADLVPALAAAAVAAGADGVMVEVHPSPQSAKSDGPQQLNLEQFDALIDRLNKIAKAVGKELA